MLRSDSPASGLMGRRAATSLRRRVALAVLGVAVAATHSPAQAQSSTPTPTPTPVASVLEATPPAVHFGGQTVLPPAGTSSRPKTVRLSVSSKQPFPVTVESITSSDPGEFRVQPNSCTTLMPGDDCKVEIVFSPSGSGRRRGVLSVSDNAANSPQTVQMTGYAKLGKLSISTRSLGFGTVEPGSTSEPRSVTLTNRNRVPMTLHGFSTSNPGIFPASSSDCGSTLAANGGKCKVTVTFQPNESGPFSGWLFIDDNADGSPQRVHLAGRGTGRRPTPTPTPKPSPTPTPTPSSRFSGFSSPMRAFPAIH